MGQAMNNSSQGSKGIQVINPSLPKGGGSAAGMGQTFTPNEFNGSGSLTIPIPASPCRDFEPSMSLNYSTGNGNSPFGMGWELSTPEIMRRTSKEMPHYNDEDTFYYSAASFLVPVRNEDGSRKTKTEGNYKVCEYQSRTQGNFDRIECHTNMLDTADVFWKVRSSQNIVSIYGKNRSAQVFDPNDPRRIFKWLLEETYDDKGNHQLFQYQKENKDNIPEKYLNQHRDTQTNTYLSAVSYGNDQAITDGSLILGESSTYLNQVHWHFEIHFDYGSWDINPKANSDKAVTDTGTWLCRKDPFSEYNAGFEIRTWRLCQRILLFHRFEEYNSGNRFLTNVLTLNHKPSTIATQLKEVTHTGYQYLDHAPYRTKSLPALSMTYQEFPPLQKDYKPQAFEQLEDMNGKALTQAIDGSFQLMDLYSEGIPGILYRSGETVSYRSRVYNGDEVPRFGAPQNISFPVGREDEQLTLTDLTGDGHLDLLVSQPQSAGYYELIDQNQWHNFKAFEQFPSNFLQQEISHQDVTGDGVADLVLIEEERVRVNASIRTQGFAKGNFQTRNTDVPTSKPDAPNAILFYADMLGSGLAQRVKVTQNTVEVWPNLGYGAFGEKVTMLDVPDFGDDFHIDRLLWADIDGSGTTDLAYLYHDHMAIYFNQSGNGFNTTPLKINLPAFWDNADQVQFADVIGNGTNCLVFQQTHPNPVVHYYNFNKTTGTSTNPAGHKPYLLTQIDNNMGAIKTMTYGSSSWCYLKDKQLGRPWVTHIPYAINVLTSVTHHDQISNTTLENCFHYSHGYYDGFERDFRGFGRVDRTDTNSFDQFTASDSGKTAAYEAPALLTKTWYHTGAYLAHHDLMKQYQKEYWQGDPKAQVLPNTEFEWLDTDSSYETIRNAHRTLHGAVIRSEVYGNDDTPWQETPYSVSQSQFTVKQLQRLFTNKYAVFLMHERQSIDWDYERNANDPRVTQQFVLKIDAYGHVLQSASIDFGRRSDQLPDDLDAQTKAQQQKVWVAVDENTFFNIDQTNTKQLGIPIESKTFEIQNIPISTTSMDFSRMEKLIADAKSGQYEKKLWHWERHYYYDAATKAALPYGQVTTPLLPYRMEMAEFDRNQLLNDEQFGSLITFTGNDKKQEVAAFVHGLLTGEESAHHGAKGGYQQPIGSGEDSQYYWNPGATQHYADSNHFYLPTSHTDPFGNTTRYHYDNYHMFVHEVVAPYNNITLISDFDYRTLHPATIVDPNQNTSSVIVDPLGMVIATSEQGTQADQTVGFAALDAYKVVEVDTLDDIFTHPEKYLQGAATFFYYNLHAWKDHKIPNHTASLNYDDYTRVNGQSASPSPSIQMTVSYHDGFGRELQSKAYCNEKQDTRSWDAQTQKVSIQKMATCWLTSGATVYNDKGHPIQQYEPYYAPDWQYTDESALNQVGYSATLFYDALGRQVLTRSAQERVGSSGAIIHEGFFTKTLFGSLINGAVKEPAYQGFLNDKLYAKLGNSTQGHTITYTELVPSPWSVLQYDANDCLNLSVYAPTPDANIDQDAIEKSKAFINTPVQHWEDSLGHTVQSMQLNVLETEQDARYLTYDLMGNERTSADARLHAQQLDNFTYSHNLSKEVVKSVSSDAGTRWMLHDVMGKPIYSCDSRGTQLFMTYDDLQRPVQNYVSKKPSTEDPLALDQITEKIIYGDTEDSNGSPYFQHPEALNLRGKPVIQLDQAGLNVMPSYDINGHGLLTAQWLRKEYEAEANWNHISKSILEALAANLAGKYQRHDFAENILPQELSTLMMQMGSTNAPACFVTSTAISAIGLPIDSTDADGNVTTPNYNSLNQVKSVAVTAGELGTKASSTGMTPGILNIAYNAKGQKTLVRYANRVKTTYSYDPFTFELTGIKSMRSSSTDHTKLQDLEYHHDPVGNITSVINNAIPTTYYKNNVVDAKASYTFDALYRLISATGREHAGMWQAAQEAKSVANSNPPLYQTPAPSKSDANALLTYTQNYAYDSSGNLLTTKHLRNATGANTTIQKNSIVATNNQIASSSFGSNSTVDYHYDPNGNMLTLSNNQTLAYNYRDNISSASANGTQNNEYYVYNSGGQRTRKVTVFQNGTNTTIKEVLYIGGIEIRRSGTQTSTGTNWNKSWHHKRLMEGDACFCDWRYWESGPLNEGTKKSQLRYQLTDFLTSSSTELDGKGKLITYQEYFPYGGTSLMTGKNQTEVKNKHYQYSGEEKDRFTQLYYYGMRYYCPWLSRWTATDPIGIRGGYNLYGFVEGNPVSDRDVGGMVNASALVRMRARKSKKNTQQINANRIAKYKKGKSYKDGTIRVHLKGERNLSGFTSGVTPVFYSNRDGAKWTDQQEDRKKVVAKHLKSQPYTDGIFWFAEVSHGLAASFNGGNGVLEAFAASPHQNTEILAIEDGIRELHKGGNAGEIKVKVTAYVYDTGEKVGTLKAMRYKILLNNKKVFDHLTDGYRPNIDISEASSLRNYVSNLTPSSPVQELHTKPSVKVAKKAPPANRNKKIVFAKRNKDKVFSNTSITDIYQPGKGLRGRGQREQVAALLRKSKMY
ncbi:SpvB/TcaC N-terminal domain-containing protein [Reichenbachiella versicolor]|uniref:SpvB/TcaC N-terminal domain-containing protein n=1 Tax=Reichenbachiella versicolor TaxID=1821036 RepID=UPI000D6E2EF0|nr:SpvB/TcaC N-terminal domain-containing protein [Reichenbachiella versicolor]